jgi:hypothetical protein
VFYDPSLAPLISRDAAVATRTVPAGSAFGITGSLPTSGSLRWYHQPARAIQRPFLQQSAEQYQQQNFGQQVFRNGTLIPLTTAFGQRPRSFVSSVRWPAARCGSPTTSRQIAGTLSRQTFDSDALLPAPGGTGVLACASALKASARIWVPGESPRCVGYLRSSSDRTWRLPTPGGYDY